MNSYGSLLEYVDYLRNIIRKNGGYIWIKF
jgi:hypothetical protein